MQIEYPIQRYDSSLSYWGNVYVLVHFAVTIVAYQLPIARRMVCFMEKVTFLLNYCKFFPIFCQIEFSYEMFMRTIPSQMLGLVK